jgi:hypothetical protein
MRHGISPMVYHSPGAPCERDPRFDEISCMWNVEHHAPAAVGEDQADERKSQQPSSQHGSKPACTHELEARASARRQDPSEDRRDGSVSLFTVLCPPPLMTQRLWLRRVRFTHDSSLGSGQARTRQLTGARKPADTSDRCCQKQAPARRTQPLAAWCRHVGCSPSSKPPVCRHSDGNAP